MWIPLIKYKLTVCYVMYSTAYWNRCWKWAHLIIRHDGHLVNVRPTDGSKFFIEIVNTAHLMVSLSFPSVCCFVFINASFRLPYRQ